jgi:hypothetical protein
MEVALIANTIAFTLLFVYLLAQRLRLARLELRRENVLLETLNHG